MGRGEEFIFRRQKCALNLECFANKNEEDKMYF
jgi:hypothetical protein